MDAQEPKDLNVKIGSEREAQWTKVRDDALRLIKDAQLSIELNTAVLKRAEAIIAEEQKALNTPES